MAMPPNFTTTTIQDNYLCVAAAFTLLFNYEAGSLAKKDITVKHVCNSYLTYQQNRVTAGEISPQWFDDSRRTIEDFAKFINPGRVVADLRSTDFQEYRQKLLERGISGKKGLGVHALDRSIMVVKAIMNYAYDIELIDTPVRFGNAFKRSSSASKRKSRNEKQIENGKRLFEISEIKKLISESTVPLKAMILLGLNAGFGNADCANLPIKAIDFKKAVIEFPRPKNGIDRVVPLWPETVNALQETLDKRPKPAKAEFENFIFLTVFGRPWVRYHVSKTDDGNMKAVSRSDAVGEQFNKLLVQLDMKRKGVGFYTLRHTFRTLADEVRDQHAIHRIMGHVIPGMSGVYVEKIELKRLRLVTEHVRKKIFAK